jgi:hypothetical protein
MKKILFLFLLILQSVISLGQDSTKKSIEISIGPTLGRTYGYISDTHASASGFLFQVNYKRSKGFYFTLTSGYLTIKAKKENNVPNVYQVPVLIGGRINVNKFTFGFSTGMSTYNGIDEDTQFAYCPSIGFTYKHIDITSRYLCSTNRDLNKRLTTGNVTLSIVL